MVRSHGFTLGSRTNQRGFFKLSLFGYCPDTSPAYPSSLEEAAWIDGCTRLGAVRRIVLPLALPGLVTTVIFVFIQSWNEFVVALTLIFTETKKPLPSESSFRKV